MHYDLQPRTQRQLTLDATPQSVEGGATEVVFQPWYSVEDIVSGTTQEIEFFSRVTADKTLSNMELPNAFPAATWVRPFGLFFEVLSPVGVAANGATWANVENIIRSSRGILRTSLNSKAYGSAPLSTVPAPGGPIGFGYSEAASAGTANVQWASNSYGSALPLFAGVTIPGQQPFSVTARWPAPITLVGGGTIQVRCTMISAWYRRIQ